MDGSPSRQELKTGVAGIVETFDSEAAALASCETAGTSMWYRALLSADQIAAGCVAAIRSQFAIAIHSAGEPTGACLFITSREIADVPEPSDAVPVSAEDALYFSPASVAVVRELIAEFNAQPSPPPGRGRAVLLVGGPSDWALLPHRTH